MPKPPKFKPRHHPDRTGSAWSISIPGNLSDTGRRQERFFSSKELALAEAQRLKVRLQNHGIAAKSLSPADEQQAAQATRLLRSKGISLSLVDVAKDYVRRWEEANASVTLGHAWSSYIKGLGKDGASSRHIQNHERTKARFYTIADQMLTNISPVDIEGVLEDSSKSYRNAQLREIRSVFAFAMKKGWVSANTAARVEFAKRKLGEVAIYTPEEVNRILHTTASLHPELVPAVALMAFAGIRPDPQDGEIVKIRWEHIISGDKTPRVELPASITKTGKRRSIKARNPLCVWLEYHHATGGHSEGLVAPCKGDILRRKLREIYTEAKVERIQDGMRHSFASYLAKAEGLDKAEQELGHAGGREILNRHYRSDVRDSEAEAFWAITAPAIKSNILRFGTK